ncbi:PASTA domain-containing protein [Solitalea koreensis]|uniref:PASTA domain, binds beta-lactams n=1 Tax=Solitalea koreensis TaxID=543615 RepID=A0A521EJK5_9SPHI|nr:PASTA domain-containing protein [Solitalea koreensis]SMO84093.1 PASTA domain, binds beta-lactams [Solitalea koreensis]
MLQRLFAFILTPEFRKNLLIALGIGFFLLIIAIFSLRFFTRHGESVTLPDFTGLTVDEAQNLVVSGNITFKVDTVYQEGKKPGTIVQQDPDANTQVKEGRTVYLLIISTTPPQVKIPDLEGKTLTEVRAILDGFGLKVGAMVYKNDIAKDVVLGASYKGEPLSAGTGLPKGAIVDLTLGDGFGAAEISAPDLTGLTREEAIFLLRGNSLFLGKVSYTGEITDSSKAKVYQQNPAYIPGDSTKIPQGSMIDIILHQEN